MSGDEDLRRVRWRCRRGLLELDLILRRFVDECYPVLTEAEQSGFQELLSKDVVVLGGGDSALDWALELVGFPASSNRHRPKTPLPR